MNERESSVEKLDLPRLFEAAAHLTGKTESWLRVLWSSMLYVNHSDMQETLIAFLIGLNV